MSISIKIPSLVIISYISTSPEIFILTLIHGATIAPFLLKLKAILAASSILNTGWVCLISGSDLWLFFIFIYSILLLASVFLLRKTSLINYSYSNKSNPYSFLLFLVVCSLAGVPPLSGFSLKWVVLTEIVNYSRSAIL